MSESKTGVKVSWKSWFALLAVLGVIAAIAIPQYGDYIHIAQASESIGLMSNAKEPLVEHFQKHGKWPVALQNVYGTTSGKYTQLVAITKGAGGTGDIELTATMRTEGVNSRVAGTTILMVSSDGGKNWICKPGTILAKNVSASCRN